MAIKSAPKKTAGKSDCKGIHKIIAAIRAVPKGEVAGYGEIARRAGLPGRARMVARILSSNDDAPLPWHRILRSDGRIAFPKDSAQYAEQIQRLRTEGVEVVNGKVRGRKTAATLDEILWASPEKTKAGKP
jgi:methylated-DNA-protein-cysteine methyltransferase related protein